MTLVGEAMTAPAVVVDVDASVDEIARMLERCGISAVPVTSSERLVGVVSTSDVLRWLASPKDEPARARSLMSSPVVVVHADEPIGDAAARLVAEGVHRLIVVDEGRPVGVIAARDLLVALHGRRIAVPIGALMTTPVQTVEIGDTIDAALGVLASTNVHGLVVVEEGWPVGVFTHHEALAARALPPDVRTQPVEEIMSYETICLDVATPTFRAVAHAIAMDVRRFLVVEERRLVGVVSCIDLVRALAGRPGTEHASARGRGVRRSVT